MSMMPLASMTRSVTGALCAAIADMILPQICSATSVRINGGRNRRKPRQARIWPMSTGGVDLNEKGPAVLLFRGDIPGEANVYGQDPVRPADGFSAVDDICPDCRAV